MNRTRNYGLNRHAGARADRQLDPTRHIEEQRRHGDLWGQLVDSGCMCPDACECDEPCEHLSYYFEDDGRKVCEECFGTLNDEDFGDHE